MTESENVDLVSQIMIGADFLQLFPLYNLCCAQIAISINGKTLDELRALFNITDDLEYPTEQEVKDLHPWIMNVDVAET